jgi:hypothetical protein
LTLPVLATPQKARKVFLDPNDYFSDYFAAALQKKQVPVSVTTDWRLADYSVRFLTENSNGSIIQDITGVVNNGSMCRVGTSTRTG